MGMFVLDAGATLICPHGGQAKPTKVAPRVMLSGVPAVTQTTVHAVAGCTLVPPAPTDVTAQWVTGAVRVKTMGEPLLLASSQSLCVASGSPLTVVVQQLRVKAT